MCCSSSARLFNSWQLAVDSTVCSYVCLRVVLCGCCSLRHICCQRRHTYTCIQTLVCLWVFEFAAKFTFASEFCGAFGIYVQIFAVLCMDICVFVFICAAHSKTINFVIFCSKWFRNELHFYGDVACVFTTITEGTEKNLGMFECIIRFWIVSDSVRIFEKKLL